ncbi:MAG: trypsin-like peptidase domain-containing protein [Bacteroidia bacterium]|nr:trypsin-like peptidase domain-containing protein [Bacteroidia bacterium]
MNKTLSAILVSALTAVATIAIYKAFENPQTIYVEQSAEPTYTNSYSDALFSGQLQREFLSASPTNFIAAAQASTPAVVNIKTRIRSSSLNFFDRGGYGGATGSGVIISPDGYVVTNNHVIEGSKEIEITLFDKREYKAELLGTDPTTDLALLKVDEENLPHLVFGNSDSTHVGEWVLAVGNPFNLESTVTAGIVSAKGRNIQILEDNYGIESFIQTDAAVNPGNSGGALVNTNGELVGINTAIITKTGKFQGYSFAVPSNLARKVINDLKDYGVVQRGILGVSIINVTSDYAERLDLPEIEGVLLTGINPGSGAAEAGLQAEDVIVKVNGIKTSTVAQLQEYVAQYRPGDEVKVEYIRSGSRRNTMVELKNKKNNTEIITAETPNITAQYGFEVRDLTDTELNSLKIDSGVQVYSITKMSEIDKTNMAPGFVITSLNGEKVKDADDFQQKFEALNGVVEIEGVYEGYSGSYFYEFKKEKF